MYKVIWDLHTHTTMSHGSGTPRQNIEAGIKAGLKRIAITDHGMGHLAYGIRNADKYIACIDRLKKEYSSQIEVMSGVELNITGLDGQTDLPDELKNAFDIKLLGYHKFVKMHGIRAYRRFYLRNPKFIEDYTRAFISAVKYNDIDVVTHPGYGIPFLIAKLAVVLRDTNTLFEINEKHTELGTGELKEALNAGAKFIISSDAHAPENVGMCSRAVKFAIMAGLSEKDIVNIAKEENT